MKKFLMLLLLLPILASANDKPVLVCDIPYDDSKNRLDITIYGPLGHHFEDDFTDRSRLQFNNDIIIGMNDRVVAQLDNTTSFYNEFNEYNLYTYTINVETMEITQVMHLYFPSEEGNSADIVINYKNIKYKGKVTCNFIDW